MGTWVLAGRSEATLPPWRSVGRDSLLLYGQLICLECRSVAQWQSCRGIQSTHLWLVERAEPRQPTEAVVDPCLSLAPKSAHFFPLSHQKKMS